MMFMNETSLKTLYDKIWDAHTVHQTPDGPAILYIDRHLIHEVTSPQAFQGLRDRGIPLRRPDLTTATIDHSIPTTDRSQPMTDEQAKKQIEQLRTNCAEFGVQLYDIDTDYQGIVHVIGPELGLTQPGMTIVCGDSHTSTHGAFGALAFGIGTSEVELVMATQCLLQTKSKTFKINVDGQLGPGVTAKDVILYIISKLGIGGATGHVIEYTGSAIRSLSMEGRMTVCNMSIEAGARAGLIAADQTTVDYLRGKQSLPKDAQAFEALAKTWLTQWQSDPGAHYDKVLELRAEDIAPMVTYGTNPGMGIAIDACVPTRESMPTAQTKAELDAALDYMNLEAGHPIAGTPIDVVFIGSCTNARLEDLRAAAKIADGKHVQAGVRALVVPGSVEVKKQAEAENLHQLFLNAGFEWREPGCSMCIAMNGDVVEAGQACASTSNRNFIGRQGKGSRSFLLSPAMAAAAAITGKLTDVRELMS
jgi:3-isopropylmalate/(R)-2-methylmalate dehydratase large subunit